MKPVELVERAICNPSRPGEVVLDAFGGSGTTLIATEKAGRAARLIELDPKYVDVIVRRWQDWTGELAYREPDGALLEGARADRLAISGEPLTMGYALRGLYLLRACKPCSARMEFSVGSPV